MANYTNSCNSELIVRPSHPDSVVRISGTLSTESCCDHLYIYDGVGISGTLLYQGQGVSQTIPPVRSSYGPLTIRFVSDGSVVNSGFSLNVSCERAPLCRYIMGVDVDNVVGASALLSWTLSGGLTNPAYFQVTVINMDDSTQTPFIDTTSNLYYLISGLQPGTHYKAIANSYCDNAIVLGDSIEFTTHCLVGGTTNPSGTSLTSVTGVPVCSGWGNTFCQSIFTVSDLLAMGLTPGPINGITYTWSSAGSYNKDLVIFLGTTANSTFSSFSPLTGSMTQVYSGQRTTSDVGTIEYYFDNQRYTITEQDTGYQYDHKMTEGENIDVYCLRFLPSFADTVRFIWNVYWLTGIFGLLFALFLFLMKKSGKMSKYVTVRKIE